MEAIGWRCLKDSSLHVGGEVLSKNFAGGIWLKWSNFEMFFDCLCHLGFHKGQFWEKTFRRPLQKRVPPWFKQVIMTTARCSLTAPLACALLKQETIARARTVVRILVHASGFEKLLGNGCLSWLRLQLIIQRASPLVIWHALGQGSANSPNKARRILTCLLVNYTWILGILVVSYLSRLA